MKTRSILALTAVAGIAAAAHGQATTASTMTYAFSFTEAPGGNGNGVIDPGESAVIHLTASFTNVNTTGAYSPFPPGPGSGTIRGFGSGFLDLNGTSNNGGNANGSWDVDPNVNGYGTNSSWDLVQNATGWGTSANSGANLLNIQMGQFPLSNTAIVATTPIVDIWTGRWTPNSYSTRTVTFQSLAGTASGGIAAAIIFKTSAGPVGASLDAQHTVFGNVAIPVAPAPASLALLGLGGLVAGRRRR